MARARNIKPGFFKNEILTELCAFDRLLFIGLWCLADREGRVEDRPRRIKMELFPCDDYKVEEGIARLREREFILQYEAGGKSVISIVNFAKHQSPHGTEKDSELPDENGDLTVHERSRNGCVTGVQRKRNVKKPENNVNPTLDKREPTVKERPDSLIPDSLIPDSPNPDSGNITPGSPPEAPAEPPPAAPGKPAPRPKKDRSDPGTETEYQAAARATWAKYAAAYRVRHGADPVRNQTVNAKLKQFIQRIGYEEAPEVAEFFLTVNDAWVVKRMHDVGDMLAQCEAYRTQWATGRRMTSGIARQTDQTASNLSVAEQLQAEFLGGGRAQ